MSRRGAIRNAGGYNIVCDTPEQLCFVAWCQGMEEFLILKQRGVRFGPNGEIKRWPGGRKKKKTCNMDRQYARQLFWELQNTMPRFILRFTHFDPEWLLNMLEISCPPQYKDMKMKIVPSKSFCIAKDFMPVQRFGTGVSRF